MIMQTKGQHENSIQKYYKLFKVVTACLSPTEGDRHFVVGDGCHPLSTVGLIREKNFTVHKKV